MTFVDASLITFPSIGVVNNYRDWQDFRVLGCDREYEINYCKIPRTCKIKLQYDPVCVKAEYFAVMKDNFIKTKLRIKNK